MYGVPTVRAACRAALPEYEEAAMENNGCALRSQIPQDYSQPVHIGYIYRVYNHSIGGSPLPFTIYTVPRLAALTCKGVTHRRGQTIFGAM